MLTENSEHNHRNNKKPVCSSKENVCNNDFLNQELKVTTYIQRGNEDNQLVQGTKLPIFQTTQKRTSPPF